MIVSGQNQQVKTIRKLRTCKDEYAFLEGPHLVEEASTAGLEFEYVIAAEDFFSSPNGRNLQPSLELEPLLVSRSVFETLTDTKTSPGVVGVARLRRSGLDRFPVRSPATYLFLERIQDPGNLGALARSAEATGVAGLVLSRGCAHPNHPRALRASAGSLLRIPVAHQTGLQPLKEHLASVSPVVIGLEARQGEDVYETEPAPVMVLAVGSEGAGLSAEARADLDRIVSIPLEPPVESLNATVAASVALYELGRRRASADSKKS